MTEREYVIRSLARYADECPNATRAELAAYLAERLDGQGGSGHLPHARQDPTYRGPDGRVRSEWLKPEHHYQYSCRKRGVYLGEMCHMRTDKPEISYEEIADFALTGSLPVQLDLFGSAA